MQLPSDGQEYVHMTFSDLPAGAPVEVSADNRVTWFPMIEDSNPAQMKFLVRGPASTQTDGVLLNGDTVLWVRVIDSPETVVRNAGIITII